MDATSLVAACFVHLMFGGIVGVLISSVFDNCLIKRLEKQLDKAVDDMFEKDLEMDELADENKKLISELNKFKAKFAEVEMPSDTEGYVSDSSTELDNTD